MSSQITFESALEVEAPLGITDLLPAGAADRSGCPTPSSVLTAPGPSFASRARARRPARSTSGCGCRCCSRSSSGSAARCVTREASADDLEDLARDHDLVVVSTGRGGLASLFEVDAARSPYTAPQRVAALTYLRGVAPDPAGAALRYHAVEGVGRVLHLPRR